MPTQAYAQITKDLLHEKYPDMPRTDGENAVTWASSGINSDWLKTDFRLLDDDGEVYYKGWLIDDPYGDNQFTVLHWAMAYAGCTVIEVKRDDKWVQEIS